MALSRILLLAAVLLGAVLRLWALNRLGYNSDGLCTPAGGRVDRSRCHAEDIFPIFRAHPIIPVSAGDHLSLLWRERPAGPPAVGWFWAADDYFATVFTSGSSCMAARLGCWRPFCWRPCPYHVIVTRQVLLDGPMVLFATLTLYLLARFGTTSIPSGCTRLARAWA